MRTHSLKLVLIFASILALGAGVFAGMAVSRMPAANSVILAPPPPQQPSIAETLQLTGVQRDQMRGIWEGVRSDVHHTFDQAQSIQKDRDAAIVAMLTDSQKARYAALTQQAAEQFATLTKQRDADFRNGVEKTKKILNDSQRQAYDRIIQDRLDAEHDGANRATAGFNGGGVNGSGGTGLASPAAEPSSTAPSIP
jgi:Spy/CpxP family protein refolding chaperone